MDDIDLIELNEPFAVQVLTWCDGMGVSPDDPRLNPYGGAIACGHPLAATGVRLLAQLAYGFGERPKARYGLTALCIGMGMGAAVVWSLSLRAPRRARPALTALTALGLPPVPSRTVPLAQHRQRRPRNAMTLETGLARVESEQGPIALVTIDNGEDYTKPTSLGRSALELACPPPRRPRGRRLEGDAAHRQAVRLLRRRRHQRVPRDRPGDGAAREQDGARALRPHCGASLPHARRDQRSRARRRRRDRVPLRLPHDLDRRRHFAAPEVFLGLFPAWGGTQLVPRLVGIETAICFNVTNPSPPEQDAHRRGGA